MTINNTANKVVVAGNGVMAVFNFSFVGVDASDISVIYTDAGGNETTLQPAQYGLTLNAAPPGQIWGIGGTVTYPLTGSPIALGTTLTIVRTVPLLQKIALGNQGSEFPSAVETAIDLLEMQLQQVSETFQRAIVAPVVDPSAPLPLPPAAQRANLALVFDSQGNPVAGAIPASGVISSAMQPVVDAATLALGRTAFGLGAMATEGIGAGLQDDGAGNARVNFQVVSVSTNQSVNAASHLTKYEATGNLTFTLARASTLWDGFGFWVDAFAGEVTLAIDANDSIQGMASGVSVLIPQGATVYVKTNALSAGTWWLEWVAPLAVDIRRYGGSGDGVTDNSAAWAKAMAALPSIGGTIVFGPGKYLFNSQVTAGTSLATTGSLSIVGQGQDATILYWPNAAGGINVSLAHPTQTIHASGFSITTGTTNGGNAIKVTQAVPLGNWAQSTFTDITFRGDDNGATDYWNTCLSLNVISGVQISGCLFWGESTGTQSVGISLLGSVATAPNYAIQINIDKCTFNSILYGLLYGSYVQGVTVEQCNFTNGEIGIYIPPAQSGVLAQLNVTDSQFNTTQDQIQLNTQLVNGFFGQNLFFCPSGHSGINAGTATVCTATGNQFANANAGVGIGITTNGTFWTITGNVFDSMNNGINLQASAEFGAITGNVFQGNTNGIICAGAGFNISGNMFNSNTLAVNVTHTVSTAEVNIQSNSYLNCTTNTSPATTTPTVTIGGGSA